MMEKEKLTITPEGETKIDKNPELRATKEIEGWLTKLEKGDLYLSKPVVDDQTGQILVSSPAAKKPKIILPLSKSQLVLGLTKKVTEAVRWLAEWCLRIIKMKPEEVTLKS